MAKQQVEVVRGWTGGPYGDRVEGDTFAYDVANDPDRLVALGLVREATASAPSKGD